MVVLVVDARLTSHEVKPANKRLCPKLITKTEKVDLTETEQESVNR